MTILPKSKKRLCLLLWLLLGSVVAFQNGNNFPGLLNGINGWTANNTWQTRYLYSVATTGAQLQIDINTACNGTLNGHIVMPPTSIVLGSQGPTNGITYGVSVPSNCTVEGHGMFKTIVQTPASAAANYRAIINAGELTNAANSNIILREFSADGNKANNANTGQIVISFDRVSFSALRNMEVKNNTGLAASCVQWLDASDNTTNTDNEVSGSYLHDCGINTTDNADALAIGGVRLRITNNSFVNMTDTCVGLQGQGTADVLIESNLCKDAQGSAGIAGGPAPATALGASLQNNHITIIGNSFGSATPIYGVFLNQTFSSQVVGNYFNIPTGVGTPAAIYLEDVSDINVTGNNVVSSAAQCISVTTGVAGAITTNVNIIGNTLRNCGQDGIRVAATGTTQFINIQGNTILDNGQKTTNTYDGVTFVNAGTMADITIEHNFISNSVGVTQRYGISFPSGSITRLRLGNNDMPSNATANLQGPLPAGTNITQTGTTSAVASRNTTLGSTTIVPAADNIGGNYLIELYAYDSALGTGCSTNTTVTWTISYSDKTGTGQTSTATETISTATGNGGTTGQDALKTSFSIDAAAFTAITYSTTYAIGTCTTGPSYAADLKALF